VLDDAVVETIIGFCKNGPEAWENAIKYKALMEVRDRYQVILSDIANDTSNSRDLRNAALDCVEIMKAGCDTALGAIVSQEFADKTLNTLVSFVVDSAWDIAMKGFGLDAVMVVGKGIRLFGNAIFNMDEYIQGYYVMDCTRYLQIAIRRSINNGTLDPFRYENEGSDVMISNSANFLIETMLKGYDYAINFAVAYKDEERAAEIFIAKAEYEKMLEDYKKQLKEEYDYYYQNASF
jgi:hypothetical protein